MRVRRKGGAKYFMWSFPFQDRCWGTVYEMCGSKNALLLIFNREMSLKPKGSSNLEDMTMFMFYLGILLWSYDHGSLVDYTIFRVEL